MDCLALFLMEYAREALLVGLASALVWLFLKADTMRPVILIFAPLVLGAAAMTEASGLTSLAAVAVGARTAMFQAVAQSGFF